MSTQFRPIEIPPGVVTKPTKQQRSSNWAEANLVRWVESQLAPIGGQSQYTNHKSGTLAAAASFNTTSNLITMVATPGWIMPGMNVFNTTTGKQVGTVQAYTYTTLLLTANAASASSGAADTLQFSGENYVFATRCKKIHSWYDLKETHYIAYLCEANLYVDIGGTLTDITPGSGVAPVPYSGGNYSAGDYSGDNTYGMTPPAPYSQIGGYGDDAYSAGNYGTGRTLTSIAAIERLPDAFSLDNFGAILLAMTSPDGRLLQWDPAVGGPATVVTAAPRGRLFVVTNERFVQIFATTQDGTVSEGSFRRFAWCDQENFNSWDFSNVTSQAGYLDIEPASPIVAAISTRNGTLFWTGTKTYVSQFLGIPYVYNYVELANNCTPWSPASTVVTSSLALWMSDQGMFSYDGTSVLPVACLVRPWVDDDINLLSVREQACMVHVSDFNEVWWFFPQDGEPYNTRVVIYSYKEGWFSQGQMSRSAGITAAYTAHTIMADGLIAYQHEAGIAYPAGVPLPWAETFDLNLTSGSQLITVKQMMPDIQGDVANVQYSLFYRMSRSLGAAEQQTRPKGVRSDGYVDFRTTGRDIRLRFQLAGPAVLPVTVGQHLIDAVPRGDR